MGGGAPGFALLYERRHPLIRGYLRHRLGARPDLVLDLVAETFARALERRDQFDPQRGTAVGWLVGISRNLLLEAVRQGRVADASRRRLGMERILLASDQLDLIERESDSELERALGILPRSNVRQSKDECSKRSPTRRSQLGSAVPSRSYASVSHVASRRSDEA